ncbi:sulfotransferase domain-containing protein [Oceanimonas sp. CHS3-5]|uniref:sulfotransferase domain-containing protein n=1 Tax=Oceanimonas sp. CHS3-5 TaxID=3068186 RepID=UPI00273D1835|nr:sulfotransferase domain-containing protein [Oceanimonas sp. CHS3-5]MDP5292529.1 sulfotransferase domain-containing protein [Oceanimonas sp. CHS3-5]
MPKINLFIVGAQKSGTSALAEFLQEHADFCLVTEKEAHIFDREGIEDISLDKIDSLYSERLKHYQNEKVSCDATPVYMFFPDIAAQLARYNPDAKLIVLLRDPAERALSQYEMEKHRGNEQYGFARAIFLERRRLSSESGLYKDNSSWRIHSYRNRGHYSRQLDNLYCYFHEKQVLILRSSDLLHYHSDTLSKVMDFLDLSPMESSPKKVFSGNYNVSLRKRLMLFLLRLYYLPEYWRLRKHYGIKFVR